MRTTSRVHGAVAGLAALVVAGTMTLTGCGGGDSRAEARPEATTSDSVSASPSPSASSKPGVAPATGKVVETSWFTVRVPEHYKVDVMGQDFHIDAAGPSGEVTFGIISLPFGKEFTVPQLARYMRGFLPGLHDAELGRRTTIDGETAYLFTAKEHFNVDSDAGLTHDGQIIHVSVSTYKTPAENRRLLESVLATWHWK